MIKKNDIILIIVIILLALTTIFIINIMKSDGSKVAITIDGKQYKTLDLNTDTIISIEGDQGNLNTVEVKHGMVHMLDADCPDKLCVKHKNIQYNHETIVCLPNKVVLEIIDGKSTDVDIIVN